MKRIKHFAILLIVVTLALMGSAYAYWTDMVAVEGTANTGRFEMKITNAYAANLQHLHHISGGVRDLTDKSVTLWISNLYPTSSWNTQQNWQLIIKNTGSIPAKLDSVTFERLLGDSNVWDQHKTWVHYILHDENYNIVHTKNPGPIPFTKIAVEDQIFSLMDGEAIPPGWYARYAIGYWLDASLADNESQDKQLKFQLTFNWVQWNAP